jgi:hypothetical protein
LKDLVAQWNFESNHSLAFWYLNPTNRSPSFFEFKTNQSYTFDLNPTIVWIGLHLVATKSFNLWSQIPWRHCSTTNVTWTVPLYYSCAKKMGLLCWQNYMKMGNDIWNWVLILTNRMLSIWIQPLSGLACIWLLLNLSI